MKPKRILLCLLVLILASLACQVEMPIEQDIVTGPTIEKLIEIEASDTDLSDRNVTEINLGFGAGELFLSPGDEALLIDGRAIYNVIDFAPVIRQTGSRVDMKTGNLELQGFPNFTDRVKNTWDLRLGQHPMNLEIKAGAYQGEFELGGLPIQRLHIADGASNVRLNFAEPNPIVMQSLRYETGASTIRIENLGNANFETMIFESGAGTYELDFSGELPASGEVFIETGLSSLTLTVPDELNVSVSLEGGLSNISLRGAWEQNGNDYYHAGDGPTLTITIQMTAGSLALRTR